MITIIRNGIAYDLDGHRYCLTHSRLVVDGQTVPFPWLPSKRRAPSIVGVALAMLLRVAA